MPDYRVDSIYDIAAIEAEQAKFLSFLDQAKKELLDLNNQRIDLKTTNVSSFTQASQELNKTINQSTDAIKNATSASVAHNQIIQQSVQVRTQQNASLQQNIKNLNDYKNALKDNIEFQKQATRDVQNGTISADAYRQKMTQLTAAQLTYKQQIATIGTAVKNQTKDTLGLTDAYTILNKEYQVAAINAKNLAVQYGVNSVEAKEAAATALALNTQIQGIDKTVGQSQKNVGNYGSAFTKGLSNVWSGLRKIAYIVPGLGIAGLISLIAGPLVEAFKSWFSASDKLFDKQKSIQQINEASADSYGKQAAELKVLKAQVEDVLIPMDKRLQVIKDIKKEYPDYFSGLTNEQILTGDVADAYDRATESILRKAKAQAAQAQIEKNSAKELKIIQKDQLDVEQTNAKLRRKTNKSTVDEFGNLIDVTKQTNTLLLGAFKKRQQSRKDEQADIKKENDFLLKYVLSGKDIKVDKPKPDKTTTTTDSLQDQSSLLKEYLKKNQEQISLYNEQELKSLLDKYKSEYENQENSENDRLASLQAYHDTEKALIEKQAQAKRDALKLQQTTDLDKAGKIKDLKLQNATIAAITKEGENELKNIDADAKREIAANDIQFSKDTIKIVQDGYKKNEEALKDHVDILKQLDEQRLNSLLTKSNKSENEQATGLITDSQVDEAGKNAKEVVKIEADLQQKLSILEKQGQLERLEINNAELEADKAKWEAFAALAGEANSYELAQVEDIEAKITENKRKEAELRKGIVTAEVNYEIQKRDELLDKVLQGESALLDTIQAFGDASFQRQADDAQKKENLLDEQTQREIELVNASVATEQEKADKIAIINARAAAEKALLDKQQRKADHDKAVFDKQIAILQIIAQIAVDIAKGQFFTAALAGAALIKLIATPVPAYKHGRGFGKDEMALVGDGGVSEYIMREGGQIEKTPAVNTLTHLMPKDRVLPNKQALMKELMLGSMQLSNYSVGNDGGITKNDIERMTNRIEQAVNGIKVPPSTQITKQGWRMVNEKNAKYDQWVNNKIKG